MEPIYKRSIPNNTLSSRSPYKEIVYYSIIILRTYNLCSPKRRTIFKLRVKHAHYTV